MSRCGWPGCSQHTFDEQFCYWHDKVVSGLADGRDVIPEGQNARPVQEQLVSRLRAVGAADEVIAANAAPRPRIRSSASSGGGIPFGYVRHV